MSKFFFIGLHVPSFFFQYIAHAFIGENFERDFMEYGIWDMNEWMVWKCYPSGVEVLAYGGGMYMILDHDIMKINSQRSQNLAMHKMIQAACKRIVSLWASCIWLC